MSETEKECEISPFHAFSQPDFLSRLPQLSVDTLDSFVESVPLSTADVADTYSTCFLKKNKDFKILVTTFQDERLLDLIKYFTVLVTINLHDRTVTNKPGLTAVILERIHMRYKLLVSRIAQKDLGCFATACFIGFNVMQHLIRSKMLEKKADSFELMNYCVELIHYKLNGFKLNSNALGKYVEHFFGRFYQLKANSRSVMNLSLPKNQMDPSEAVFGAPSTNLFGYKVDKNFRKSALGKRDGSIASFMGSNPQLLGRADLIDSKLGELMGGYDSIVTDFTKLMRAFVEKRQSHNQTEKHVPSVDCELPKDTQRMHRGVNINSISPAMQVTTLNTKKDVFVRDLTRLGGSQSGRESEVPGNPRGEPAECQGGGQGSRRAQSKQPKRGHFHQ
jgi:hypothetical protein